MQYYMLSMEPNKVSYILFLKTTSYGENFWPSSVEKVEKTCTVYSDFVTILRGALMQYITKLAMSQSQKPRFPIPQNII